MSKTLIFITAVFSGLALRCVHDCYAANKKLEQGLTESNEIVRELAQQRDQLLKDVAAEKRINQGLREFYSSYYGKNPSDVE